jgi:hypothetical protein
MRQNDFSALAKLHKFQSPLARSASPNNQLVPFAHFVPAGRAIVKRLSLFGVEVGRAAAFMATALKEMRLPQTSSVQCGTYFQVIKRTRNIMEMDMENTKKTVNSFASFKLFSLSKFHKPNGCS